MKPWTRDTFYKVRLCVRWDDHAAPMLDLPVGCLFGGGDDAVGKDVSLLKMYSAGFSMDGADTPWYFCDLSTPAHAAFADTDFEIPARRTRGKGQQETTWTRHQGSPGV